MSDLRREIAERIAANIDLRDIERAMSEYAAAVLEEAIGSELYRPGELFVCNDPAEFMAGVTCMRTRFTETLRARAAEERGK